MRWTMGEQEEEVVVVEFHKGKVVDFHRGAAKCHMMEVHGWDLLGRSEQRPRSHALFSYSVSVLRV